MRLIEFTDAKEQLALLRLIVDNTWNAIAQQAKAQDAQKVASKSTIKAIKKPTKSMLSKAANLGAKAKVNAQQQRPVAQPVQQQQFKQPVQAMQQVQQQVPRQPSQSRPLSNTIKPVSTTQNMSTANTPTALPQISPAPLKK